MKLGFGLMRLPLADENDHSSIDLQALKDMADAFLTAGGTYFDTAYPYHLGHSEAAFREAVAERYPREAYLLADKLPVFRIDTAEQIPEIFDRQLQRCGVDYFDYYLLHALDGQSYDKAERMGAFSFVAQKKAESKIRRMGFSFHGSPALLEEILQKHPEMDFVQLQINYLDWEDPTVCSRECYEIATRHQKPVIVMEPVKGGALAHPAPRAEERLRAQDAGKSMASWAIRFAAGLPNVQMVLSGMGSQEQMDDNLSFMKAFVPLDEAEGGAVWEAAELIRQSIAVACTACRYCMENCPQKVAIADCFTMLNDLYCYSGPRRDAARLRYAKLVKSGGHAAECIECGRCEGRCPQHLPIRELLRRAARELGEENSLGN